MTDLAIRVGGVLVLTGALTCGAVAQPPQADRAQSGVLPSGLGDAVDRDVARVRDATARFKSTEAAEEAGYKRVTDCVEYQPYGAMGYHFQNNTLLDTTIGAIPVVGDAFDIMFRANMKNMALLRRHMEKRGFQRAVDRPIIEAEAVRVR